MGRSVFYAFHIINLNYQASHELVKLFIGNDLLQTVVLFKLGIFTNQSSI